MASKRRLRRKQCERKVTHATRAAADAAFGALKRTGKFHGTPYRCPFCHRWHLGHAPGYQRRNLSRVPLLPLAA